MKYFLFRFNFFIFLVLSAILSVFLTECRIKIYITGVFDVFMLLGFWLCRSWLSGIRGGGRKTKVGVAGGRAENEHKNPPAGSRDTKSLVNSKNAPPPKLQTF